MTRKFLDNVYDKTGATVGDLYDDWAATYEAEVAENGYVTPGRCAKALATYAKDKTAPILDFGCGTGLSGLALRAEGFLTLDGLDLSAEMLEQARNKNIYRNLAQVDATSPLPVKPGEYAAIAAIGVIGPGAAPLDLFDTLAKLLSGGALMVFSFNDHALEDPAYEARLNEYLDMGALRLLFREHGAHLPQRDIKSNVYVIEKP
ncbi:class I SAM-dependent DNA methyltransferase [Shimia abyssi]|uniref:Methyltransferase family protein n=1 Tax=Shimia abyssi TaxID=1662395 RepID=A0A2P8F6Q9_9RHOB|nr:methyltransferase domain-containing protein [Shimia abyssi]PSL17382.1 methyltransferase family protein [Shimia abyssi]